MRRRFALAALAIVALTWSAALVAAPSAGLPRLSAVAYAAGGLICHQRPERSFHRDGAQYPVCARCLGLYLGAVAGVVGWCVIAGLNTVPTARGARLATIDAVRRGLLVTALPTIATVALAWTGIWDGSNIVRATLAMPLGAVIATAIAAVAAGDLR